MCPIFNFIDYVEKTQLRLNFKRDSENICQVSATRVKRETLEVSDDIV